MGSGTIHLLTFQPLLMTNILGQSTQSEWLEDPEKIYPMKDVEQIERTISCFQGGLSQTENLRRILVAKQVAIGKLQGECGRLTVSERVQAELEKALKSVTEHEEWLRHTKGSLSRNLALSRALHSGEVGRGQLYIKWERLDTHATADRAMKFAATMPALERLWAELQPITALPGVGNAANEEELDAIDEEWVLVGGS